MSGAQDRLDSLRALVDAYEGALLRYVSRLMGNASSAEDVVQNTFLKFIRKWRKSLEVSPDASRWLYRVAHNEAVDFMRSESRLRRLHEEHGAEAMSHPVAASNPSERAENAAQALSRLTDRERELVVLKVYEEKSYAEIADITGLSTGNVGYILHNAMKKLAAMIQEGNDG